MNEVSEEILKADIAGWKRGRAQLREQIARAIEQELDGDNPVWDRAIMVATSIAKGKKE